MSDRYVVRLTAHGTRASRRDKVYAVCTSYTEAAEICAILNARGSGEIAWTDTLRA